MYMCVFAFLALSTVKVNAADSFIVLYNKHVIFKGMTEQENAAAYIKAKEFKNTDSITIIYKSENADKGWKRTFYMVDAKERNIKTIELLKQSGSVSMNASALQEMKEKKQPVFIYTVSLPADPKLAAGIRVRRIMLCKIEWN